MTATCDGKLQALAVEDGTVLWEVTPHPDSPDVSSDNACQLAVLGAGVVASCEKTSYFIRTWNADTGQQLGELNVGGGGAGVFSLAAITSRQFAAGNGSGEIVVYDHEQGKGLEKASKLHRAEGILPHVDHAEGIAPVTHMAVCGERLASLDYLGLVTIWYLQTRRSVAVIKDVGKPFPLVSDICVSLVAMSDNVVVFAAKDAPYLRVYSVANNYKNIGGNCASDWVHDRDARSVRILGSGYVMSTSDDGTIAITELQSKEVVARIKPGFIPLASDVLSD